MRLSNKSTFSLVCLILLLGFIAVPVMAHAPLDDGTKPGNLDHDHPVKETLPAVNLNPGTDPGQDNDTDDPGEAEVTPHNAHPMPVITLKSGQDNVRGTMIALDATTNTTFTLVVDFGMDVTTGATNTDTTGIADGDLTIADAAHTTLQVDNTAATDAGLAITRVADDASMFEVVVTPGLYPDADTADTATNDDTLMFRIQLPAGGLFSLQTIEIINAVDPVNVPGGASLGSDLYTYTLVKELGDPPTPPDTTGPVLTYTTTPDDNSALEAGDTVQFTITADEALGTGNNELLAGDVTGTANVANMSFVKVSNTQYVVIVTPTDRTQPIVLTIAADAVMNTATTPMGNAETVLMFTPEDMTAPTVTITAVPEKDANDADTGKIVYTFTFSEPLGTGDAAFTASDLTRGTGVTLAGNPEMDATDNKVYTVLVNPSTVGDTILQLNTGSVADAAGNTLVGDQSHTYKAPDAPDTPVVDPTKPANGFNFTVPADNPATPNINEGYVILVRSKSAAISNAPPIGQDFDRITDIDDNRVIPDARIIEWAAMPNLAELFDRGATGGGGAIVLRKQAGDTAAPAVGTVGISEILWAIDVGYIGQSRARNSQWIEIHNLNTTAKKVRIYATTGAEFTSSRVVVDTVAGDRLYGKLGDANETKQVVDVVTNYFNGSDRGNAGWDVPGSNGSSRTGINFVSMARIPHRGSFNLTRRHENKGDKPLDGLYNNAKGAENSRDGRASGSWAASTTEYEPQRSMDPDSVTTHVPTLYHFVGTPGRPNTHAAASHIVKDGRTDVPASPIIINEVANRRHEDNEYEWIELRNVHPTDEVNLNNYQISILTGADKDNQFIILSNNNNAKIPAGGVLLLVDSDPFGDPDHPLAIGWNVDKNPEDQVPGLAGIGISATSKHGRYKVVKFGQANTAFDQGLPDDGNFILVVRRPDNHEGDHGHGGKGRSELGKDDLDKINDVAGWTDGLGKANYTNAVSKTDFWPLKAQGGPDDRNKLSADKVRFRRNVTTRDGRAGSGNTHNDRKPDQLAFKDVGYSGIGYKRQAANNNMHGGTPGYDNGVQKGALKDIGTAKLIISEIMLSQGPEDARTKLPQWIEIYNPSPYPVHLGGWRLIIENPRDPIRTINLGNGSVKTILSEQTIIVVSGTTRDFGSDALPASTVFPSTRVYNVFKQDKDEFGMQDRFDPILDQEAFHITLIDGRALDLAKETPTADHLRIGRQYFTISDIVGNLDGDARTNDTPEDNGKMKFEMGLTEDEERTSLIRIFDDGVARDGTGMVKPLGGTDGVGVARMKGVDDMYSWVHAADTSDRYVRHTWFGDETDWGTPLDRGGQILPVELSFFRPTLADGKVTIRWTTESELDNAGFNILRSETRNGEFKQVNTELIQGAGTTGEKTTYSWVDATAKPGVVYYYQIEDVSFAGEHQALAITKLKGLISATNKLTTTWGELKEVQ
ncbi:MAG: lamin tail domain-containing protein [Candidatus Poribacteria bacterium]|nr:lamin tail domain-containing protein [Candidatus Poribacteria bacterium]